MNNTVVSGVMGEGGGGRKQNIMKVKGSTLNSNNKKGNNYIFIFVI